MSTHLELTRLEKIFKLITHDQDCRHKEMVILENHKTLSKNFVKEYAIIYEENWSHRFL